MKPLEEALAFYAKTGGRMVRTIRRRKRRNFRVHRADTLSVAAYRMVASS